MGAAHCSVVNQTVHPVCVITFNMADLIYKTYHTMYIIEPGETQTVEANPDPNGLQLGIIYETRKEKQELYFQRFTCSNDSVLTITSVDGNDIDYYGEGTSLQGKGKLRESSVDPFNMAAATLQNEFAKQRELTKTEQEVKKFFKNVKESGDAVLQKVGDKLNLDLTGGNSSHPYNSNHPQQQNHIPESPSSVSLNSNLQGNNSNGNLHGMIQYDEHNAGNHVPSFYQQSNNNNMNRGNGMMPSATPSTMTNTPSSRLGGGQFVKIEENRQFQPPPQKAVDPAEEARRWEEELERAKKEKRWEAEIERIKKERELRAAEEAEAKKNPKRYAPEPEKPGTAPVADANCKVCVIS